MTRKRDVLVLKLAGGMLREVNRKCICYVQSSHAAVRIYIAGHTATAVRYDNGVPVAVYRVRQSLPKLLERFVILGDCIPSRVAILVDDLVREQRARVNLGFALGEDFQKSTAALFVSSRLHRDSRAV